MFVAMMRIGKMRMVVLERGVAMRMVVRLPGRRFGIVLVDVMFIVCVQVFVLNRLVLVSVAVPLAQEQQDAGGHEQHRQTVEPTQGSTE